MSLFITAFIVIILGLVVVQQTSQDVESIGLQTTSINQTLLADNGSAQTLTETPITLTATGRNRTWVGCDGTNDLLTIPFDVSISFWYKNETVDWQHVVNTSEGKTFVNGTDSTPFLIPFYVSGDNYILCKTDATTFVNVSIDEIKTYDGFVNESTALEIYNEGR